MSRWLEKQEKLIEEEAEAAGVPVVRPYSPESSMRKWQQGDFHTWHRGDSLFDIAQDMHVTHKQLLEYNEIESYQELEDGIPIYYPAPAISAARRIEVEVFPQAMKMHVAKTGGAKKWAFGSMNTWDEAQPNGFFPESTNVHIVAIARVPILDKEDPAAEAAYYLDHGALGDYRETGLLRFAIGFAWSDLEEGHVDTMVKKQQPAPEPVSDVTAEELNTAPAPEKVAQPRVPKFLEGYSPEFIEKRLEDFKRDGSMHGFTETYQKLNPVVPCMAIFADGDPRIQVEPSTGQKFVWVRDFAMKRTDRRLFLHQEVDIAATFEYDGEIYGRPAESVKANNFFGIPMSVLQSQDDLFMYNKPIDATTRAQIGGRLTWAEEFIWVPANRWLSRYAPGYMKKVKQKAQKG